MVHLNESGWPSNFTNQTSYTDPFACSYPVSYVRFTGLMVVLIIAVAGNVLVMVLFYRKNTHRTSVDYFIASIAASDVFIPLTYISPMLSGVLHKDNRWLMDGILGSALCKITFYSWQVSRFVSLLSIIIIAADRFRGILFPFKRALIDQKRRSLVITAAWIVSMVIPAYYFYGVRLVSHDAKSYCVFQWDPPVYTVDVLRISFILFFCPTAASAAVLTVLYSRIVIHLYKENRTLHLSSEIIKERAIRNRKTTTMLVVVVLAFYAVWSPFTVNSLIWIFKPERQRLQCSGISLLSYLGNPVINPLIYYVFIKKYRRGVHELLCCCCNKESRTTVIPLSERNTQPQGSGQEHEESENNEAADHSL